MGRPGKRPLLLSSLASSTWQCSVTASLPSPQSEPECGWGPQSQPPGHTSPLGAGPSAHSALAKARVRSPGSQEAKGEDGRPRAQRLPVQTVTCHCLVGPWLQLSSQPSWTLGHPGSCGQGCLQEQNPPHSGLFLGLLQLGLALWTADDSSHLLSAHPGAAHPGLHPRVRTPEAEACLRGCGATCPGAKNGPAPVGNSSWGQEGGAARPPGPPHTLLRGCTLGLPGGTGATSAAGEVPNSLEMILRRGGGAGASVGVRGAGQAEGTWRGGCRASCGVPGLELPVDMVLGGTSGDWDPEDGLCPLVASGVAWPRLRASITSRKMS